MAYPDIEMETRRHRDAVYERESEREKRWGGGVGSTLHLSEITIFFSSSFVIKIHKLLAHELSTHTQMHQPTIAIERTRYLPLFGQVFGGALPHGTISRVISSLSALDVSCA